MPFTCEACGRRDWPDLLPPAGDVLRCPNCSATRPFVKRPLLIVTGPPGAGKSVLCARLSGTIPRTMLLDADIFAEEFISVAPPNNDYPTFWRSMMRLAHEVAQNDVTVVLFSTMLPEQVLVNRDVLGYFDTVRFLCLSCPPEVLRARLSRRDGEHSEFEERLPIWTAFNDALVAAAADVPTATVVDAGRALDDVAADVGRWITASARRPPDPRRRRRPIAEG